MGSVLMMKELFRTELDYVRLLGNGFTISLVLPSRSSWEATQRFERSVHVRRTLVVSVPPSGFKRLGKYG